MAILDQKILDRDGDLIHYTVISQPGDGVIIVRLDSYAKPISGNWYEIRVYKTVPDISTGNPLYWQVGYILEHRVSPVKDDPSIISAYQYWVSKYTNPRPVDR